MADQDDVLLEFSSNWHAYQTLLIEALTPLTPEQLELRSAPHLRTVSAIAGHIVGARANWLYNFLGVRGTGSEAVSDLVAWSQPESAPQSAAELVGGLELSWRFLQEALARWTPADMEQIHSRLRRGHPFSASRRWVVWHLIEHDLHHGGEASLTLGIHGIPALDL